jgi:enoyl-CoA hydratase/carnithine racemase
MDHTRSFHRSALRAFSPAVMTARASARHFRAPVVLLDTDRAVTGTVWALDAADAADTVSARGAPELAEALMKSGNERATRVVVLSREGASLWIADGDLTLVSESWVKIGDAVEDRKTEPMAG